MPEVGTFKMVFVGKFDSEKIESEIEDFLFRRGFELVDMRLEANHTRPIIEVFVDSLGGITVKDLTEVNRRLNLFLEASDFFPSEFQLLVSSPGLDRVIKKEADFVRFTGRKIQITLQNTGDRKSKKSEVTLLGFKDGVLTVELHDSSTAEFALDEIKKVRLVPDISFKTDGAK